MVLKDTVSFICTWFLGFQLEIRTTQMLTQNVLGIFNNKDMCDIVNE